jgi:hypothetical protein
MTNEIHRIIADLTDKDVSWDAPLDELILCPLTRMYTLHMDLEDAFDIYIPDDIAANWRIVADVERTIGELL